MASAMPRSSDSGPGMGAGDVDEGHDRQPAPLGELHDPHRLAVALGVRHAEVAPHVLLGVGALLLADDHDAAAVDPREARDDRLVVAEQAVAVELDELVGDLGEELEDPRAAQVAGELDARPDAAFSSTGATVAAAAGSRGLGRLAAAVADAVNHGRPPARAADEAQDLGQLASQVRALHDPVDEAVAEQELGSLEARRQLLADGPGADARAREPDQRVRLGQVDVPHRRVGGEHAARGRVRHDRHVRDARRAQPLEGGHRLGQLHQRQRTFLHPGAAGRRDHDQRDALVERRLGRAGDLLADDRAHRAAHEPEVHDEDRDPLALDPPEAPDGRVAQPGRELRRGDAIGVRLLVDEPQRVLGHEPGVALLERVLVEQLAPAGPARRGGSGARTTGTRSSPSRAAC